MSGIAKRGLRTKFLGENPELEDGGSEEIPRHEFPPRPLIGTASVHKNEAYAGDMAVRMGP